jgi:hypothetical protein
VVLGVSEASLINVRLPGELPADCGINVTVKETLWPAATVTGNVIPLSEYPSPDWSTVETVTVELLAVRDPVLEELLPTATLPKATVVGDTESCPGLGAVLEVAGARLHPASRAVARNTNPNK